MRNSIKTFEQTIAKTLVVLAVLLAFGSCNVQKRYHSNGLNIQFSLRKNGVESVGKVAEKTKTATTISTLSKMANTPKMEITQQGSSAEFTEDQAFKNTFAPIPNPPTASISVQKISQTAHFTKHKPYKIPSLEYQNSYNKMVIKAADMDAKSFNNFQWAVRLNRWALYSIGIIISALLIFAVLSISLTGLGPIGRKLFMYSIIGIPGALEIASLATLFAGFINIELGSLFYQQAIKQLPVTLKLRAEANILSARLPYVSKKFTIRTAKTIIQKYQTQPNATYLSSVEQTLAELQRKKPAVATDAWKDTKDIGKFLGIALLITLLFALMP